MHSQVRAKGNNSELYRKAHQVNKCIQYLNCIEICFGGSVLLLLACNIYVEAMFFHLLLPQVSPYSKRIVFREDMIDSTKPVHSVTKSTSSIWNKVVNI